MASTRSSIGVDAAVGAPPPPAWPARRRWRLALVVVPLAALLELLGTGTDPVRLVPGWIAAALICAWLLAGLARRQRLGRVIGPALLALAATSLLLPAADDASNAIGGAIAAAAAGLSIMVAGLRMQHRLLLPLLVCAMLQVVLAGLALALLLGAGATGEHRPPLGLAAALAHLMLVVRLLAIAGPAAPEWRFPRRCAAVMIAIGSLVSLGWLVDDATLVQAGTSQVPMQFNTALGVWLAGLSLWLLVDGRRNAALLVLLPSVPFAAAALAEEYLQLPLDSGQWLLHHGVVAEGVNAGRMAPNSAIGLLLGALAILLAPAQPDAAPGRWAPTWAAGFIIAATALIVLAGYVLGAPELRAWGLRTPMALWTGLAMAAYGLGLGSVGTGPRSARHRRSAWMPLLLAMGSVVASVLVWQALDADRERTVRLQLEQRAERVGQVLQSAHAAHVAALQRMIDRLALIEDERTLARHFDIDSTALLRDFPSLAGLARLDADGRPQQLAGSPGTWPAATLGTLRTLVRAPVEPGARPKTTTLPLSDGGSGQVLAFVLNRSAGPPDRVIAVLDLRRLARDELAGTVDPIRLGHAGETLYEQPGVGPRPAMRQALSIGGMPMQLQLDPPPNSLKRQHLATALLLTSLFTGGLLALALRLAALARERAEAAEASSRQLQNQVSQRRRVETALSASQRMIAEVLESVSDAVLMVDADWRFSYVNPHAEQLLRRPREELVGRSLWSLYPDARPTFGPVYERALREQSTQTTEQFYPPLQAWFEVRAYPTPHGLAIYFRDVTARREQQQRLEQSELLLAVAGRSARLGGWGIDLDQTRVQWTEQVCAIHEVPAGTSPTVDEAIDFYAPEYRDRIRRLFDDCCRDGTGWDAELEIVTAAGRRLWVRSIGVGQRDAAGHIVRVHGAFQDISERKQTELELREVADDKSRALEELRQLTDSALEAICSLDEEGRLVTVNRAAERLWGYPAAELIGQRPDRLIHPDDLAATREALQRAAAGEPIDDFRNRNLTRDGRVLHMQWSASGSARTRRTYCIGRDRTQQHGDEQTAAGQRAILAGIASGAPLDSSLVALARLYEQQFPGSACSLLLLDGDGRRVRSAAAPSLPPAYVAAIDGSPIGPAAGSCGTALWRREMVIVGDIATDPLWADYAGLALAHGLRACWALPVRSSSDEVLASFAVYYHEPRLPSDDERFALQGMAAISAIAIEQAARTATIERSSERLRRLADAGIAINRSIGQPGLYQQLVDLLRDTVRARMAVLSLTNGADWSHAMTAVSLADEHAQWRSFDAVPDGSGIYREVFVSRRPLRLNEAGLASHPAFRHFGGHAGHPPLRGLLAVPLIGSDGTPLGVLQLSDKRDGAFDDDDEAIALQFAQMAATALERSRLIDRLRERDRFFDMALELFCVYDPQQMRFLQVNPAFARLLGHAEVELLSRPVIDFVHADDREATRRSLAHLRDTGDELLGLVNRLRAADGSTCWLEWAGSADESGHYHLVARNITERQRIERERDFAETHDAATGLPRYPVLEIVLADMLDRGLAPSLLFIDLDRLHAINESMGHGIGDEALRQTASRLAGVIGDTERIARFAGDEFVAVVPGLDGDEAMALAERLRQAVAMPLEIDGYRVFLTASIGISRAPLHGDNATDLLRRAEAAMTQAKQHGRDGICEFSVQHMAQLEDRRVLGGRLREAIGNGELCLHYQPRVRAADQHLNGFEALARWDSAELGPIPPDRFVPIAEALGLMPELGAWVLQQACRQVRAWLEQGRRDFTIAVNVSAHQLQRPDLVDQVRAALAAERIPPAMLEIELTESSLMENIDRVQATLAELKTLGVSLSLDDFGTGYSSLAYLKQFSLDKLKIDRRFVRDLPEDSNDAAIARTIVAMAHQLKMTVAAEGVETEAQASFLRDIGCDELQGYWFGRPLPAESAQPLFDAD